MKKLAVLATCIFLVACANLNPVQRMIVACEAYASTLNTLTAYRKAGRLSEEQIETINLVEPGVTEACLGDPTNATSSLLDTIEFGLWQLLEVKGNAS